MEFLTGDYNSAKGSATTDQLSLEKVQENLTRLMKENTSFDEICSWITVSNITSCTRVLYNCVCRQSSTNLLFQANVGNRDKDPKFIRHLMTAILETTLGTYYKILFLKIFNDIQVMRKKT